MLPVIFSLEKDVVSEAEFRFFRDCDPSGFIVFSRNCKNTEQLYGLTSQLKEAVGRDCPVLVDQEGGRVERLKGKNFAENESGISMPPMLEFGLEYLKNPDESVLKLKKSIEKTAKELKKCGINVNCAPVLDVLPFFEQNNANKELKNTVIGDRSFGFDENVVTELGSIVCKTYLENGITPVIKHMIGHGKALVDSHKALPVLDINIDDLEDSDLIPFTKISKSFDNKDIWGMTAHVIYKQIDPDNVATLSNTVITDIIRKKIGFSGCLLSDDISMNALEYAGNLEERAIKALKAGCNKVLYCAGNYNEMQRLANVLS